MLLYKFMLAVLWSCGGFLLFVYILLTNILEAPKSDLGPDFMTVEVQK